MRMEKNKLTVKNKDGVWYIDFQKIIYLEYMDKKISLYTDDAQVVFSGTMGHVQDLLPTYFIRCHRGFIVNEHKIRNLNFGKNYLTVSSGKVIPISRSYKKVFREKIG